MEEIKFKLRAMVEIPDELQENVIDAGTVEDSNYGKIGHTEGDCYYIYYENKWYYCQYNSIITGFTGKEYAPFKYGIEFKFEECDYSTVAEYVGLYEDDDWNKMSPEILEFVKNTLH